jgi:hypothetical protein
MNKVGGTVIQQMSFVSTVHWLENEAILVFPPGKSSRAIVLTNGIFFIKQHTVRFHGKASAFSNTSTHFQYQVPYTVKFFLRSCDRALLMY